MRVPAHQLRADLVDGVADREVARLLADLREEDRLVEVVAKLLAQLRQVAGINGVEHLVGFLEHERAQRCVRLLAVPRAAARRAQRAHDLDQLLEFVPDVLSHVAHLGIWDLGFGIWDLLWVGRMLAFVFRHD